MPLLSYRSWRQAHLGLAFIVMLVLFVLSATGLMLAIENLRERASLSQPYSQWTSLSVADLVDDIEELYTEPLSLEVSPLGEVRLEYIDDASGEVVMQAISPHDPRATGEVYTPSRWAVWARSMHRSLFLHDFGRHIVGVVACLFVLLLLTGLALILRQRGLRGLWMPIEASTRAMWLHVALGRLLLLPLLVVGVTGAMLYMDRLSGGRHDEPTQLTLDLGRSDDVRVLSELTLGEISRIDLPFVDDTERIYTITPRASQLALDLHTGRSSTLWSLALGLMAVGCLLFVATGLVMYIQRRRVADSGGRSTSTEGDTSETIRLLVASQMGSTMRIARQIQERWRAEGLAVELSTLNEYTAPQPHQLVVACVATYGEGISPDNGDRFAELLRAMPPQTPFRFAVLAFGSKRYPHYCAYGIEVDRLLGDVAGAQRLLLVRTIHNRSQADIEEWLSSMEPHLSER